MFKAIVRYMLEHCIYMGQQYCTQGHRQDRYEACRLLRQAMYSCPLSIM